MSFDDVSLNCDEEFELVQNPTGDLEYPLKYVPNAHCIWILIWMVIHITFHRPVQFSSVHHLSLYFPTNFGASNTRIYYIGLRGEFSEAHYHGVTICSYESAPNFSDHKNNVFDSVNHRVQWDATSCDPPPETDLKNNNPSELFFFFWYFVIFNARNNGNVIIAIVEYT